MPWVTVSKLFQQNISVSGDTRDIVLPVTHVGLGAPLETCVTLSPVRSVLSTLVVNTAVLWIREVTLTLRTLEPGHVTTCPHNTVSGFTCCSVPIIPGNLHQP